MLARAPHARGRFKHDDCLSDDEAFEDVSVAEGAAGSVSPPVAQHACGCVISIARTVAAPRSRSLRMRCREL